MTFTPRLVALDIDGTLVDYRTDLPASAAAAVPNCPAVCSGSIVSRLNPPPAPSR